MKALPEHLPCRADWRKQWFDPGDYIEWIDFHTGRKCCGCVRAVKTNQFGRVSYRVNSRKECVLYEDIWKAIGNNAERIEFHRLGPRPDPGIESPDPRELLRLLKLFIKAIETKGWTRDKDWEQMHTLALQKLHSLERKL